MKRRSITVACLLAAAVCLAAEAPTESPVARELAPYRRKLASPDEAVRQKAYDAYLNAGSEGRELLREALLALRKARLDACRGISIASASQKKLLAIHEKVEEARKEARRVIFDKKIYPDADHGRAGQPVVDKAVELAKQGVEKYHQPAFGWALARVPRSRLARGRARGKALMVGFPSGSLLRRFRKLAAAHQHVLEIDTRLALCGAEGVELRPSLQSLVGPGVEPELVEALAEIAEFLDYVERCLLYNARVATSMSEGEREVVDLTNEYRIQLGIRPLAINQLLARAARKHSQEMARLGYFGHTSPKEENRTPGKRCRNEGYGHYRGENCASGASASGAFRMWYHSSGHHRNMLNPKSTEIGVGHAGPWTEDFGADPDLDLDHPPRKWDSPNAEK